MVYVQRGSCPAEALTFASAISSHADAPISFGTLDIPAEAEEVAMDLGDPPPSAQSFAIATPPTQAESNHDKQEVQTSAKVVLEDENDIQVGQVAEPEVTEDPFMLFQQMDHTDVKAATAEAPAAPPLPWPDVQPATAEVYSAKLQDAEFEKYRAYLQEHVLHWTTEPDFVEWCGPDSWEKSVEEDTKRKCDLGEAFRAQFRKDYSGAQLAWFEMVFERHGNWWKNEGFKSGRSLRKRSIWDKPVEDSVLAKLPALPVRDTAGNVIEIQPNCFRNTQDPHILRREVFPNRPDQRPPIMDSWLTSGWQNP